MLLQLKGSHRIIASAVLLCIAGGCGQSSIIGKWRMSGGSDATLWEFRTNGAIRVGDVRGKYRFGANDRIKIETPFATTVYQVKMTGDQLVLQEPGGSKLQFTKVKETQR